VDPAPLRALWAAGFLPVVSPVANGPLGEAVNVNADEAALGIARAVGATALVYLSDVDGVRLGERTAETLTPEEARQRIEDGTIAGGMALKVRVALEASAAGIPEVVIAGKARLLGQFAGTRIVAGEAGETRPSSGSSRNGQIPRNPLDGDSAGEPGA
jgi:acetylglutamate kinase